MSALARYFKAAGKVVAGYDKTPSGITDALEDLGIAISFEDSEEAIPSAFKNKETTLVVYTPAVPKMQRYCSKKMNSKRILNRSLKN